MSHRRIGRCALVVLLLSALSACSNLLLDNEQDCRGGELLCRDTYLSKGVSGQMIADHGQVGIYGLARVSGRGHGILQLRFFRLQNSLEAYVVRKVRLSTVETMTQGRVVQFDAAGVSATLEGEFDYSAYFPAILAEIMLDVGLRHYRCDLQLEYTRTGSYLKALKSEPVMPTSVAEFKGLIASVQSAAPRVARAPSQCVERLSSGT